MTEPQGSATSSAPTSSAALVDLQHDDLHAVLGEHAVVFRHGLAEDSLLAVDALGPLAATLPAAWIRAHHAQYDPRERRGKDPLDADCDLSDVICTLATSAASIRLYNLELTSEFRELAAGFEREVRALVGPDEGGLELVNVGTFLASPTAVTPAHPDRHHNLLLQVHGRKEVWVENDLDRRRRHLRSVSYLTRPQDGAPELPPARSFILEPGDGVYIPPYAFHWTTVLDDEPAVGVSVGFSTPATVRSGVAHDWDIRMRKLGLRPRPASPGSTSESTKVKLANAAVRTAPTRKRFKTWLPW